MKKGTKPQIVTKPREPLESTLKTYSSKLENLDEMDKFLDTYNQTKLNQEDITHLNSPITHNDIEAVVKSLPTKNHPGPNGFTTKFHQTFKEELTPILLKLFQEI
jgi:hypothetical protein